ncbi:MAG: ArnT family glycosyltransferase, partial [Pseudobdellovibrionaceae bacterium]
MNKIFFYLFTSSILVKLWLAAFIPLAPDEAYYRLWSQYLQLSYFDHPPMIAWMIFISEKIGVVLPSPELTVRIFGVLIHHATAFIIVKLYQKIIQRSQFGKEEICVFLLFLFHPLLGFFQILQTPDLPLLFFWSLSNLIFFELLTSKKPTLFFLLGFVLGLGLLSKYMIVLWGFSLIVLFLLHYRQRSLWFLISSRNVVIGFLALFLASAPVWIWNVMNGWASFKFQINHGFEAPGFEYHWVYNYLAGVAILSGAYLFSVDFSKVQAFNETQRIQTHFIVIQLFLPLLFFLNSSFHAPTEVNWPIMGYMSLPILIVLLGRSQKWINVAVVGSGVVTMIMAVAVLGPWVKIPQIEQMK